MITNIMDEELKQCLTEFGLGHCIPMCWNELGFLSMTDVNETDLDDDFTELINDTFQKKDADNIILFIKTHKTARTVSLRANYQSTAVSSSIIDSSTGRDMRECYLLLLCNRSKTVKDRQEYFYNYFVLPYISNIDETLDEKTYINFEGRTYEFNQNTISIGRGCPEYPVDIVIKYRNPCDLSVSRVNCIITRVRSDEGYVYNLLDAWSMVETRVTKTNPMNTLITSKDDVNIISWNSKETVYISCGDKSCNNKIQFISNISPSNDQIEEYVVDEVEENIVEGLKEEENIVEELIKEEENHCVICFEPATIRLSCGHATYCSKECLDKHVAHQNTTNNAPECPYCKTKWQHNKVSVCERYYKN